MKINIGRFSLRAAVVLVALLLAFRAGVESAKPQGPDGYEMFLSSVGIDSDGLSKAQRRQIADGLIKYAAQVEKQKKATTPDQQMMTQKNDGKE